MLQIARAALMHRLILAGAGLLLGCPQLLDDDFESLNATPDGGESECAGGASCGNPGGHGGEAPLVGGSGQGGGSGRGGAGTSGAGGRGAAGAAGTTGSAGSAGAGGAGGANGVSGSSGAGGAGGSSSSPACWTITLNDSTHSLAGNCLGIEGWNAVEKDPLDSLTAVDVRYQNGNVCFDGSISTSHWGAVYSLTFAPGDGENSWNAGLRGVSGFELGISGPSLPPKIDFKYTVQNQGDWCRVINPVTTIEIPFSSTHPGCQPTGGVPDATKLTHIRLAMHPAQAAYNIDFCVQLRAIP